MNLSRQQSIDYTKRSFHRSKSTCTVAPILKFDPAKQYPNARLVQIRLVFLHLGEIDTLNEKYQADIYFEARWIENRMNLNSLNLTPQQQTQLYENLIIKINELNPTIHWTPQLFIENAIGQFGTQDRWFTIKKNHSDSTQPSSPLCLNLEICEHRRMNGIYWEKLELNHFPADVQDLSISITSHHPIEKCVLIPNKEIRSFINREAFADQQEWSLYEHVATDLRQTQDEYSFEDENNTIEQKNHSVVVFTCRAARRPGYYYWNGFCLIFLITICSFCVFSIPPNLPQNRLQITCTLVLTSITFRWVVNRSLPQISYLTTLDIYAIISIIILVVLCVWHSIIAAIISLASNLSIELQPTDIYTRIDRYIFVGLFSIYIIIHIALFIWFQSVPYERRREMVRLDRKYVVEQKNQSKRDLNFRRSSSVINTFSPMKIPRMIRQTDSNGVLPNGSAFIPIQEIPNSTRKNTITMVEVQNPDDKYFDDENSNHIPHFN